ncbi:hypothetical protein ACTNB0_16425 [Lachnospiraceae bacterium HCP28S3_F9]|uniref:hypothetical protein n=1 Tax=Bariatricus sp. SGI.161 TaxID=3420550 RepID=UPI0030284DA5|nr:hypothetical protein [Lachnospiraceae bacterium]
MNITQVSTLSDVSIGFHLEMTGNSSFQAADITYDANDESTVYITTLRAVFPDTDQYDNAYFVYNINSNSFYYGAHGYNEEKLMENVKRVYLGSEKDCVLIWKAANIE